MTKMSGALRPDPEKLQTCTRRVKNKAPLWAGSPVVKVLRTPCHRVPSLFQKLQFPTRLQDTHQACPLFEPPAKTAKEIVVTLRKGSCLVAQPLRSLVRHGACMLR